MKIYISIIIISISLTSCSKSNKYILNSVVDNLNNLKTVKYSSVLEAKENGRPIFNDTTLFAFDFTKNKLKYHLLNSSAERVYNGELIQNIKHKEKVVIVKKTTDTNVINNPLISSLYYLKNVIPKFIENKEIHTERINDTLINRTPCYGFKFTLKKAYINFVNYNYEKGIDYNSTYFLFIDKSSLLPYKYISPMGENTTSSTTIENVDVNFKFKENQWTQEIYPDGYLITTSNEYDKKLRNTVLKNIGKQIKSFELPVLNKEDTVDISKLKGNVILLEFWFKGCGPCLASIPNLNKIEAEHKGKKFKLYGIETKEKNSSDELISYIKKQKIQYENLSNGKKFSEAYNIVKAPTFFLIDKNGTIVSIKTGYSEQNMKELELLIEQLL